MAARSMLTSHSVNVEYQLGVTTDGKGVFAKQAFDVKKDLTDDQIMSFVDEVQKVIDFSISSIGKDVKYQMARG